jgi:HNH endonuclease
VSVDRIIPGCQGGTYRRENIRPACGRCNSVYGATLRSY